MSNNLTVVTNIRRFMMVSIYDWDNGLGNMFLTALSLKPSSFNIAFSESRNSVIRFSSSPGAGNRCPEFLASPAASAVVAKNFIATGYPPIDGSIPTSFRRLMWQIVLKMLSSDVPERRLVHFPASFRRSMRSPCAFPGLRQDFSSEVGSS
jgi:hypothetical protein